MGGILEFLCRHQISKSGLNKNCVKVVELALINIQMFADILHGSLHFCHMFTRVIFASFTLKEI